MLIFFFFDIFSFQFYSLQPVFSLVTLTTRCDQHTFCHLLLHRLELSRNPTLRSLSDQCAQTELDGDTVKSILSEYKIHNADVTLRSDCTADDLIDVVEGNR